MKYRKTPQTLRGTYKLYDDDGNFITEYKPGKDGVTEVDIHNLHRIDDHEVYVNCKEIKLPEWYQPIPDAYEEAKKRLNFLKHVIEEQDGYRLFYYKGQPIQREADLQIIYRLVWFGSPLDVNREVNNGRGPVDYKVSYGEKNSTLVEFKLASNTKLKNNLANQIDAYKSASNTKRAIKVILFFSLKEEQKVISILNELKIIGSKDIILIDARNDNKPSASNIK